MIGILVVVVIDVGLFFCICINGNFFKNGIGVYYFFVMMIVDCSFFSILLKGYICNGMVEIIKMVVIDDWVLFELLEEYG